VVDVGLVCDVEAVLFQEFLFEFSHSEANAADGIRIVGYGEL